MIAYNHKTLDNLIIHDEVNWTQQDHLILKTEAKAIKEKYPVDFYTPNLFIRVGLFLLTLVIGIMSIGLFMLLSNTSLERELGGVLMFFSLATYTGLEFTIRQKKHYRSGIDDALLWTSTGLLLTSFTIISHFPSTLIESTFIFAVSCYCFLRFGNAIMAGIAFFAFLAILFNAIQPLGAPARIILPFLMMAVSFLVYWAAQKATDKIIFRHYRNCLVLVQALSLLTLYASGNYFIVRELSIEMFSLPEEQSLPGAWAFWILTVSIPLIYLFRGIQKKDMVLLRCGLALIVAIVYTIDHYHELASVDVMISVAGIVMIAASYFITKLLTPSRYGFTHVAPDDPRMADIAQLESLAIAQTFHATGPKQSGFDFGGGSTGGGGASDQY